MNTDRCARKRASQLIDNYSSSVVGEETSLPNGTHAYTDFTICQVEGCQVECRVAAQVKGSIIIGLVLEQKGQCTSNVDEEV